MTRALAACTRTARAAAALAGTAVRFVSLSATSVVAAFFICYGLGLIYRPLLFIAAGAFLLLADRKHTLEHKQETERRTGR